MRVVSTIVYNFASYDKLYFTFDAQGLCLVAGATGSGKSTLCDIIPWILFGKTAKDGSVDEIRPWTSAEYTYGKIIIAIGSSELTIERTRGKSNDLLLTYDGVEARGKDITDTQRLINESLGFDYATYTTGAYFHEFSKTASFFTTTAKTRRSILEQVVDLSSATELQAKAADSKKELKKEISALDNEVSSLSSKIGYINARTAELELKSKNFEAEILEQESIKNKKLTLLASEIESYEEKLTKLNAKKPSNTCGHCGSVKDKTLVQSIRMVEDSINKNIYALETLQKPIKISNNYLEIIDKNKSEKEQFDKTLLKKSKLLQTKNTEYQDLETLAEVIDAYRAAIITTTVGFLEDSTNLFLSNYFDGIIKVVLTVESSDKLDAVIYKDGNECSYTQLSKGQRQLLKLCFGLSIMTCVSNHKGINFNAIFLDEALDGLDDILKVKAYGLLQSLQSTYDSIFVVEHSAELKALFEKSYVVTINNGTSSIEEK